MDSNYILPPERIDDLQINGLKIIQNPNRFCFGTDAVLLSDFSSKSIKKDACVLDMCSGNGIVGILLSAKSAASKIYALEVQKDVADMASRSVKMNHLDEKITTVCGNLINAEDIFGRSFFNNIVCNPPYKKSGHGIVNSEDPITIARHEILCDLEDIIRVSSILLRPYGKLHLVHRPERVADILCLMRKYKIEPKLMRFVHPSPYKAPTMVLVEGAYCGGENLRLDAPLYVYNENGEYSDEINQIYNRGYNC